MFFELFEPVVDLFHFHRVKMVVNFPASLVLRQQLAVGKYLDVLGYCLTRGIEMLGQSIRRHGLRGDQHQDRPSRWIGNCLKNVCFHLFIKILRNSLVANIYATFGLRNIFLVFFLGLKPEAIG